MKRETAKSLHDAMTACTKIEQYTADGPLRSQLGADGLQLIIERLLMIVGEALYRVRQTDDGVFDQIPDAHKIIGLRNRIVHGYDTIDNDLLRDIAVTKVPELRRVLAALLDQYDREVRRSV